MRHLETLAAVMIALGCSGGCSPDQMRDLSWLKTPQERRAVAYTWGKDQAPDLNGFGGDVLGLNKDLRTAHIIIDSDARAEDVRARGLRPLTLTEERALYPKIYPECRDRKFDERPHLPDPSYLDLGEIEAELQDLAAKHPERAAYFGLTKQGDSMRIPALLISSGSKTHPPRSMPAFVFSSLFHAREIMSVEVTMDMARQLLEAYERVPLYREWVDNSRIWIIPVMNPTGYQRVWNGDPMMRKNLLPGGRSVDLNRNFPTNFGQCNGSSDNPASQTFRGPEPFSETETRAFDTFIAGQLPMVSLSYHSNGESIIYPSGCPNQPNPEKHVFESLAGGIAEHIPLDCSDGHYNHGEQWDLYYNLDGDDITHLYRTHHVYALTAEVGSNFLGFHPPYEPWRHLNVDKLRRTWQYALHYSWQHGLRVLLNNPQGVTTQAVLSLERLDAPTAAPTTLVLQPNSPIAQFLTTPGRYHLRVAADGYPTFDTEIDTRSCGKLRCLKNLWIDMQPGATKATTKLLEVNPDDL